jgi:hypothetical protein
MVGLIWNLILDFGEYLLPISNQGLNPGFVDCSLELFGTFDSALPWGHVTALTVIILG